MNEQNGDDWEELPRINPVLILSLVVLALALVRVS